MLSLLNGNMAATNGCKGLPSKEALSAPESRAVIKYIHQKTETSCNKCLISTPPKN